MPERRLLAEDTPDVITDDERETCRLRAMTVGPFPLWAEPCARDLLATLLSESEPFPCTFAVGAARNASLRLVFIDSEHDPAAWAALGDALAAYLEIYRTLGRDTSLVALFRPGGGAPEPLAAYHARFWSVLQHLHDTDEQPWPHDLPTDPDNVWWEFAYRGTPIFVVCNTPAYLRRRSRHSPQFMITFQPRWVFEGLEADSPRGRAARRVIRRRIRAYDDLDPAPELGSYGDPANREWRQYFLPDGPADTSLPPRCPFHSARGATTPPQPRTSPEDDGAG